MEHRKLYSGVPASLPNTSRWRYASSVRERGPVSLVDCLSFAEEHLSNEAAHLEDGDIDSYFVEPGTFPGTAEWLIVH